MLFNSFTFLCLFLPLVLAGWWVVFRRPVLRLGFLTLASYVFYGYFQHWTGLRLLPLLLVSTLIDYYSGRYIHRSSNPVLRKRVLIGALSCNLGLLAIFKYLGFFESTLNAIMSLTDTGLAVPVHALILPIGISFYTFNSMSYTIDIYRKRVEPARNVLEYSAFVAMFPHLIAGPIVRYSDIDQQLRSLHQKLTASMVGIGSMFFIAGLFKKVVVADSLAPTVDHLFAHASDLTMLTGWMAALGYSLQLYFDFSGYSDMAVGLAMLLGFQFPQNFNSPYTAVNIADFWNRWHMTLSRWLRDYVYIPLGGNRHGALLTARNLFVTMFLGGLWHGASWVFVAWGIGHGILLVAHRVASSRGVVPPSKWMSRAITFICVAALWVPFRAGAMPDAVSVTGEVLGSMLGIGGGNLESVSLVWMGWVAVLLVFVNRAPNTWTIRIHARPAYAVVAAFMLTCSILMLTKPSPFLYFRF